MALRQLPNWALIGEADADNDNDNNGSNSLICQYHQVSKVVKSRPLHDCASAKKLRYLKFRFVVPVNTV